MKTNKRIIITTISALAFIGIFAGFKWEQDVDIGSRLQDDVLVATSGMPASSSPVSVVSVATLETSITAKSYLVGDVSTGKIYLEQGSSYVLPIASLSKLMTALVACATLSPTAKVTITEEEATLPPDGSYIRSGETYTLSDILYPLLLDSSNIAAQAIASSSDLSSFLRSMRDYATEIGMTNTYFSDPSGLSVNDRSSAKDIFTLAQYLYKNKPDILRLTRTYITSVASTTTHGAHVFMSIHPFVNDPRFLGGKTGRTPMAGETMLTILNIANHPLAFIILGSDNAARARDTDILINKVQEVL